jgi:4-amino-4-deoxy-L-arabinose transferase-like glycosyltransferase
MMRLFGVRTAFRIFAIAFLIRLLAVMFLPQSAPDTGTYHNIAINLLERGAFSLDGIMPTGRFAPVYPAFLAASYKLFGTVFLPVRMIQVIIDSFTCVLIYHIALMLFRRGRVGVISGLIASFHPSLIGSTTFVLTETLYAFLLTVSVLLLVKAAKSAKIRAYCLAGAALGIATLCRPTSMLFPLFLLAGAVFPLRSRIRIAGVVALALTLLVVIMPWTVRNFIVFEEFIPVAIGGGGNLWIGSYIPWDGDFRYQDLSDKRKIEEGYSPLEADRRLWEEGIKNIKNNPAGYLKLCVKKFGRFWFGIPGSKEVLKGMAVVLKLLYAGHFILLAFFVVGVKRAFSELNPGITILFLMIFYFTLTHVVLFAIPRYRIPIMPLVIVFSAVGISQSMRMRSAWLEPPSAT